MNRFGTAGHKPYNALIAEIGATLRAGGQLSVETMLAAQDAGIDITTLAAAEEYVSPSTLTH